EVPQRFNFGIFKEYKEFGLFLASIFIFGMGTLSITLILLRPIELGASAVSIPLFYLAYSLSFVLAAIPLGRLSDRLGEKLIIPFGFVMAISAYLILAFTDSISLVVFAFVILGIYSAATDGIARAFASKLVCPELLATGQGFLHAAIGISSLLAGIFGGLLWTSFGSAFAFIYGAGLSLIGLIFFLSLSFARPKKLDCRTR
ncbi:MAG: MFS transporter, partial [Candidatus Colwellbacteria bacterium]|nr:MFS transporter [Candidatus Colwellbacteria bacterium]